MRTKKSIVAAAVLAAILFGGRGARAAPKLSLSSLAKSSLIEREPAGALFCPAWERLGVCAMQSSAARDSLFPSPLGLRLVPAQVSVPAFMRLAQTFIDSLKIGEVGAWSIKLHLELR